MEKELNHKKNNPEAVAPEPEDMLTKAIRKRDMFLENRPELRAYQEEIDRILDSAGDSESRMTVLGMLMEGKLRELRKSFSQLNQLVTSMSR
jgi:hypothetical protein